MQPSIGAAEISIAELDALLERARQGRFLNRPVIPGHPRCLSIRRLSRHRTGRTYTESVVSTLISSLARKVRRLEWMEQEVT